MNTEKIMIKKLLPLLLVMFLSLQLAGQTSKSKFMRNKIVSKYPKYTFQDEASTALLIVDGKVTDIYGLSSVSRKQFSKLTLHNKKLAGYVKKYGKAASNGVFEIETKNHLAEIWLADIIAVDTSHKLKQMVSSRGFDYSRLMIIYNGRELSTEFFKEQKIDVKSISSMNLESFGGIYGGMLTIETGKVALYGDSELEKAGIKVAPAAAAAVATVASVSTPVAVKKSKPVAVKKSKPVVVKKAKPVVVIPPTGFEVRLPSKSSKANVAPSTVASSTVPDVSSVVATTVAASTIPDVSSVATPEPVVVEKIVDNKVYPFQAVDVMATFPSCESEPNKQAKYVCFQRSLMKHVIKNFRYPPRAQEDGIQGRVIVKFVIQKDGSIGEISVLRGVNKDLDKEAMRIVTKIPNIIPAQVDGDNVKVSTMLPITFKLR